MIHFFDLILDNRDIVMNISIKQYPVIEESVEKSRAGGGRGGGRGGGQYKHI